MKRMLILIVAMAIASAASAQSLAFYKFAKKYTGTEGTSVVEITDKMTRSMAANSKQSGNEKQAQLLRSIRGIRIVSDKLRREEFRREMLAIPETAKTRNGEFKLVSSVSENGRQTMFYFGERDLLYSSELLMLSIDDKEYVALDITGDFTIADISQLSQLGTTGK